MRAATVPGHTLVWIDTRDAIIVGHRAGAVVIERITSDVPDHRRSTGHVRHDPTMHGGGGSAPLSQGEPQRQEHLARFLRIVADRLPVADELIILGPGTVRDHLEQELVGSDRRHHRMRTITSATAERMTERQLVARLNREFGIEPRRRTVGAYRWSGRPSTTPSGRPQAVPSRVTHKPPHAPEEEEVEV